MSISFSDDDLPGRMPSPHIRALHITAYIGNHAVSKVLVDTGFFSLSTLRALSIPQDTLLPSPVFVTAYDNSRRAAKGRLVTDRTLGPLTLTTAFHVIDIVTSFNLLLGTCTPDNKSWIPSAVKRIYLLVDWLVVLL